MAVTDLGGGKFRVRVYNPNMGGSQYQKVVHGKRAADAHEAEMRVKFARGQVIDPNAGKITFGKYAQEALEARRLTPGTRANYLRLIERIMPIWGHRPLRSLKHSDAIGLTTALRAQSDGGSTHNAIVLARSICRQALADGYLDRNPFASLKMTTGHAARPDSEPTWEQVRAASRGRSKSAAQVMLMATSGLRRGEVAGLELAGIDWLRRTITVTQQLRAMSAAQAERIGSGKSGFYLSPAKTPAGRDRVIPVPQFLLDTLAAYLSTHPAVERTLPWTEPEAARTRTTSLVFGLATTDTMTRSITDRGRKAGGTWSPHDLRHLYASTLEQAGVPLRTVQEVMGHAPKGITGMYTHVQAHSLELIVPVIEGAWFGAADESRHVTRAL